MHVGLIMDGNGRWATRKGFDRIEGHKSGAKVVEEIIKSTLDELIVKDERKPRPG